MSVQTLRTPSYRIHKPTGEAVVRLCGRDPYRGRFGTRESRAEYDRIIDTPSRNSGSRIWRLGPMVGTDAS